MFLVTRLSIKIFAALNSNKNRNATITTIPAYWMDCTGSNNGPIIIYSRFNQSACFRTVRIHESIPPTLGHSLDLVRAYISKGWTLAVGQHGHAPNISYTLSNYTLFYPDRCEELVMLGSYLPIRSRTVFGFDKLPIGHHDTAKKHYLAYVSLIFLSLFVYLTVFNHLHFERNKIECSLFGAARQMESYLFYFLFIFRMEHFWNTIKI